MDEGLIRSLLINNQTDFSTFSITELEEMQGLGQALQHEVRRQLRDFHTFSSEDLPGYMQDPNWYGKARHYSHSLDKGMARLNAYLIKCRRKRKFERWSADEKLHAYNDAFVQAANKILSSDTLTEIKREMLKNNAGLADIWEQDEDFNQDEGFEQGENL